ncbi:MAG: FxsA family protein [Methylococcaceae bacterium]|nr:FxsA family protein [Methylococcaceae bacterium]
MNIAQSLMLALLALPILEIYLLIQIGGLIGFLPTLLLLFGAAGLGTYLLQTQGWSTWMRLQQSLARGESPANELVNGAVIVAGAALLLFPGFLSDVAGLLCLIPLTRRWIAAWLVQNRLGMGPMKDQQEPKVIEGEFKRDD